MAAETLPHSSRALCVRQHGNPTPQDRVVEVLTCLLVKGEPMNERMRVAFPTEAQANAFIEGIEYLEDDHVMTEGPEADLDSEGAVEYAVFIRRFA